MGGFVGGCWQAAGLDISFIGRPAFARDIARHGLVLSDYDGWSATLPAADVAYGIDPATLADADLIVLCVKSGATGDAARQVADHARPGTAVLSLQNGISNVDVLREILGPGFPVFRGMVPFNVAYLGNGQFHKGVAGQLYADDVPAMRQLSAAIGPSPAAVNLSQDMLGIAWGKLLINLNNAINALSGQPLLPELRNRGYRRVFAASMREGLTLLKSAGIRPAKVGAVGPRLLPWVIAAPDLLFNSLFLKGWKIDDRARSSMADDLARGRKTEVDFINGEVVGLAERLGRDAPVNRRIVALVNAAENGAGPLQPDALCRAALGRQR
ncbi:2-dehydropantoate 2-reductase [Sphingomonas xanthus]|uniref:2-dehydropantoate 2-reductase n=1 Tax=Sphingomonas xanthus TaxID=2594473 RepID=UPI001FE86383|nr:2-dehydropantoate 2-reductase [Sphingomonas xanthus]